MALPPAAWLPQNPALVPEAVAMGILQEASVECGRPLPREWAVELVERAKLHVRTNSRFRKIMHRAGDESRDWLWTFMRHWTKAALLQGHPRGHCGPHAVR